MQKTVSLAPSLNKFCEKVRVMNQTNSKSLVLTAAEARNIESDLMNLLITITDLQSERLKQTQAIEIEIQPPKF